MPIEIDNKAQCPECFQKCEWCSDYRRHVRLAGCPAKIRSCAKAKKDRGKACGTCDGSGVTTKVIVIGPLTQDQRDSLRHLADNETLKPGDPAWQTKIG